MSQPPTPLISRRINLTLAKLLMLLPGVLAACCVVTAYVIDALGGPIDPWLMASVLIVELLLVGLSRGAACRSDGLRLSGPFD